jgi:hypothetical protein
VLLGATGVLAASTAVIGLVLVRWSHPKRNGDVSLTFSPTAFGVGGHFQ